MQRRFRFAWRKEQRLDMAALGILTAAFVLFFSPVMLGGRWLVTNDALLYSYPLRSLAWQMLSRGEAPFWTPHILSGYPLLSMAQLALAYPLTWGYLVLPGHVAEHIYVLAPFLLSSLFLYGYVRRLGCSRAAGVLAGLSYAYGGFSVSPLGEAAMFPNAVLWLPLYLLILESCHAHSFGRSLLWATVVYWLSVLTGLGQGFLYVALLGLAYALLLCFIQPASPRRWRPLLVAVGSIAFAAAFTAWQILETLPPQRDSIRRTLDFATFSGDDFGFVELLRLLFNPLPHFLGPYSAFRYEVTPFVAWLGLLCAVCAVVRARQPRVAFWLVLAGLSFVLMLGDATPLYRVLYAIPVVNLFRNAGRHAFEWTFAVAVLAAFGWDVWATRCGTVGQNLSRARAWTVSAILLLATLGGTACLWWKLQQPGAIKRQIVTLVEAPPAIWPDGLTPTQLLAAKALLTALVLLTLWWSRRAMAGWPRAVVVTLTLLCACLWEPALIVKNWWFLQARPTEFFTTTPAATRFLQQFEPHAGRVFTTMSGGFQLDLRRADPHDHSARRGLHDAAGYEPLMPVRYSEVFGKGWHATTPDLSQPRDPQVLKPEFRGFDLLHVRYVEWFAATLPSTIEREGTRFAALDAGFALLPKQTQTLHAHVLPVTMLSLVTTLANAVAYANGEPCARVVIHLTDGRKLEHILKVGIDSAESLYDSSERKPRIRHTQAPQFDTLPGAATPIYRYWTRLPLDREAVVERVEITNLTDDATLYVSRVSAYAEGKPPVLLLTPRLPGWRKLYDAEFVQVYENPRVLPRVWLTDQVRQVTPDEALRAVRGEMPFEPLQETLVEMSGIALSQRFTQAPQARIVSYAANHLAIETNADAPAVLNVSERYAPGWTATLNGQPVSIFVTNYLLRGVAVPAGKHRVEMRYTAPAAQRGMWVTLVALVVFVGVVAWTVRPRRTANAPPSPQNCA